MKTRRSPKRVHPKTIIAGFQEVFKSVVIKQTSLRNLLLSVVAACVAKTFRINELAARLPISVKNEKSKQKRLLRFLATAFPVAGAISAWGQFVLHRVWRGLSGKHPLLLVDETDLHDGWKAIVASVAFRHRAIPIFWQVYSDAEIRDGIYKSHNEIITTFCEQTSALVRGAFPQRALKPLFVFDRGFARTKYVLDPLKANGIPFLMRVPRNASVLTENGWHRLDTLPDGFQGAVLYHKTHHLPVNLSVHNAPDVQDPMFLISTLAQGPALFQLYKRRMQIEHGFRDLKATFGFGTLVLQRKEKPRMELLFLIAILAYGLCFLGYEKSAPRWAKTLTTGKQKTFAIPTVIKRVLTEEWSPQKLRRWFARVTGPGFTLTQTLTFS